MLTIPEEIKEIFKTGVSKRVKIKLRFFDEDVRLLFPEDTLFPSEDLFPADQEPCYVIENRQIVSESMVITESLCEQQSLVFGQCNAARFEITVANVLQDFTGYEFLATLEVADYEMALGIYRVDSFVRQADRRKKKITAYNRMLNFQTDVAEWYRGLVFPMTLKQFRDSLCAHIGVKQIDTELPLDGMTVTKTIDPEQLSGLDVLKAICEINGCFGQVDRTGRVIYVSLCRSGLFPSEELFPADDLFPSEMTEGETVPYYKRSATAYEDYVVTSIDMVQIRQEEGDVGAVYGSGSNCYIIQGNFLAYGKSASELERIAAAAYEQMSGRIYRPCTIVCPALPWVEVGDGILCYTSDDVIETYCLKRTMKGIQALSDTYEAQGEVAQRQNFGVKTQIMQLEGKTAVIKKSVEEVSVKVTDLKAYTEAQFKITADQILAEVKRAQEAEASLKVLADSISLSVKDLRNDMNSEFTQMAGLIDMKVSKGDVSSQLSIEPDAINLRTNRLSWQSTYSSMTADGTLTCRNLHAVNGWFEGNLESSNFMADDSGTYLGDYEVSVDGSNVFRSTDGSIGFQTAQGGPFGSYAALVLSSRSGTTTVSDHSINVGSLTANGINGNVSLRGSGSSTGWGSGKYTLYDALDIIWQAILDIRADM